MQRTSQGIDLGANGHRQGHPAPRSQDSRAAPFIGVRAHGSGGSMGPPSRISTALFAFLRFVLSVKARQRASGAASKARIGSAGAAIFDAQLGPSHPTGASFLSRTWIGVPQASAGGPLGSG